MIQVLDPVTIDKIAAGEVVERPASIVKELVENAIDSGASCITVEIKDGGISMIRITDDGCGIPTEEVRVAFLRHSTSKIKTVDDLNSVKTLGFRGEALSSIAAISQVEVITKTKEELFGIRYEIEGGIEKKIEETGAKDGTTFIVRQIFFNTPARRKFLKTPMTEASHIQELLIRLALSHPDISFSFINQNQTKLHTSGNGNLKEVIYQIYGKEVTDNLIEVKDSALGLRIEGFIGKPIISRGNRNFENYFINGRYVKSNVIAKAIEDGYKDFTMQHKYPFVVLHFSMNGEDLDVNVHPTKMEVRFSNQQRVYDSIYETISLNLHGKELIPKVEVTSIPEKQKMANEKKEEKTEEKNLEYFMGKMKERVASYHNQMSQAEVKNRHEVFRPSLQLSKIQEAVNYRKDLEKEQIREQDNEQKQLNLFETHLLEKEAVNQHKMIGQLFETYWLVEYQDQLYMIDQHAAHERVLYEKILSELRNREHTSQYISPPIILDLTMQESLILKKYMDSFYELGFEIEEFGSESFAVRAVPDNLFSIAKKELLIEMLDQLNDEFRTNVAPDMILEKIATMACKAAVKGNSKLSIREIEVLIKDLLNLENPYHCPHGRPTIISMTKQEIEKKFKRIV